MLLGIGTAVHAVAFYTHHCDHQQERNTRSAATHVGTARIQYFHNGINQQNFHTNNIKEFIVLSIYYGVYTENALKKNHGHMLLTGSGTMNDEQISVRPAVAYETHRRVYEYGVNLY